MVKYQKLCVLTCYEFHELAELSWAANFNLLPTDKFWQNIRLNLTMNTTLHCNWYEQLNYFVFIELPGIEEFIKKKLHSLKIKWQSKEGPNNWLWQ